MIKYFPPNILFFSSSQRYVKIKEFEHYHTVLLIHTQTKSVSVMETHPDSCSLSSLLALLIFGPDQHPRVFLWYPHHYTQWIHLDLLNLQMLYLTPLATCSNQSHGMHACVEQIPNERSLGLAGTPILKDSTRMWTCRSFPPWSLWLL